MKGFVIRPPFFELGPKAFLYGKAALELALAADRLAERYDVDIIYTPQSVDLRMIAAAVKRVLVFAQHMDPLEPGKGVGSVLPEAVKEAGAAGVLLNHAERRLSLSDLARTVERAREVGLATLVCADDAAQALAAAQLGPDIILAEPPGLIGAAGGGVEARDYVRRINESIRAVDPGIRVLHGAGIAGPEDVRAMIALGAEATGCTSAVVRAPDPAKMLEMMIQALREAWDARQRR